MLTAQDADLAMQTLSGKLFLGRPLKARPCDQKRINDGRQHSSRLQLGRWASSPPNHSMMPFDVSTEGATDLLAPIREGRRVYVGGLTKPMNNHASDLEIRSLFGGFNVEAVSKVKWPDVETTHDGGWYAFVDFGSAEEAQRAIGQRHGARLGDGRLVVRIASGVPEKVLARVIDDESC
jgi:RNA recognition motif-containing protein